MSKRLLEWKKMNKIGFSQGVLYKFDTFAKEIFDIYLGNGTEVIEVHFKSKDIDNLNEIIPYVKKFGYKSVHLPTDIRYGDNQETKKVLEKICKFYNDIKADLIVLHPVQVGDWKVFDDYSVNWSIENMDSRQSDYKNPDDFKKFFVQKNNWKMVLDLNHCYTNDRSMKLAQDFIDEFKHRIAEIHLSGFVDFHEPLYKTEQKIILDFCKKINVPIVIESGFNSVDGVKREMEYVRNGLSN